MSGRNDVNMKMLWVAGIRPYRIMKKKNEISSRDVLLTISSCLAGTNICIRVRLRFKPISSCALHDVCHITEQAQTCRNARSTLDSVLTDDVTPAIRIDAFNALHHRIETNCSSCSTALEFGQLGQLMNAHKHACNKTHNVHRRNTIKNVSRK